MPIKLTQEEFLSRCRKVWGERFDLSKAKYINKDSCIEVVCDRHGSFFPIAHNFMNGHGCLKCAREERAKKTSLTKDEFISKAISVHGFEYDYSSVIYHNNKTPVDIICPKHGVFSQRPDLHLRGNKCPKCTGKIKHTKESFIERAIQVHGNKYDYSKVVYVANHKPVIISCPEHGDFIQEPNSHLHGRGCPVCGIKKRNETNSDTLSDFIKKATAVHGDYYDYSLTNYVRTADNVTIICPKHGEFSITPMAHLRGHGCSRCSMSAGELSVIEFLDSNGIRYETQKKFEGCKDKGLLKFDFFIPKANTCIEYQGAQHYYITNFFNDTAEEFQNRLRRDQIKRDYCQSHGISLIEIKYTDNVKEVLTKQLL